MIDVIDLLVDLLFDDLAQLEVVLRFAWPRARRGCRRLVCLARGLTVARIDGGQAERDQIDAGLRARLEARRWA